MVTAFHSRHRRSAKPAQIASCGLMQHATARRIPHKVERFARPAVTLATIKLTHKIVGFPRAIPVWTGEKANAALPSRTCFTRSDVVRRNSDASEKPKATTERMHHAS